MISFPRFWSHRDLVIDLPGGFQLGWGVVGWWKTLHISLEKKVKSKEILRIMQPRKTAATIDGSSHIVITRWLQFSVAMAAWEPKFFQFEARRLPLRRSFREGSYTNGLTEIGHDVDPTPEAS